MSNDKIPIYTPLKYPKAVTTDTLKELLEILWQMNTAIGLASADGPHAQLMVNKMLPEIGDRIMKIKEGI